MKKLLVLVCVFFIGLASVNAMSEKELKSKLTQSYTVNGATFKATDSQKTAIEQYLNQYKVSSSDADYIVSKLEEAFNVLKASGKTSFYKMSKTDKNKIIALVSDVATHTSVKVAIVKGNLVVYKPGTNEIFYETPVNPVNGDVVQTSRGLTVAVAGIISAIGIAIALRKVRVNA